jgi:aerobic C4-dicarboxylate transport protein
MAAIFIAQATNTPLTIGDQFVILGVLLLTSKGSAGVAGAGFVTLAATLSSVGTVPVTGLVLLLGVDRFMNEARAVTNLIGNGIATIAIAKWDGALDQAMVQEVINEQNGTAPPTIIDSEPEPVPLSLSHR